MSVLDISLAARNLSRVVFNHAAKLLRRVRQRARRGVKQAAESSKEAQANVRQAIGVVKDGGHATYRASVRAARYAKRVESRVWPRVRREIRIGGELRRVAAGSGPIVVGPWLSEVGYEVLYWVPFLRWFVDRYRVDRSRLVVVSRGGVSGWYGDVSSRYVELLELFAADEFAARNAERQANTDQKQSGLSPFDEEIIQRVRALPGMAEAHVCHPSSMFGLLRQFWLGNESLEYAQQYLRFARVSPPPLELPPLPERFTAVKFYTGKAIPDTPPNRRHLRDVVEHLASQGPVVTLDTGVALDEHQDYLFRDIAGVQSAAAWLTPQTNLGVQTEVIRRASSFVSTCGGLAWLAPMLGTPTVAFYADDYFLRPHLYAATGAYRELGAAFFGPMDLQGLEVVGSVFGARAGR